MRVRLASIVESGQTTRTAAADTSVVTFVPWHHETRHGPKTAIRSTLGDQKFLVAVNVVETCIRVVVAPLSRRARRMHCPLHRSPVDYRGVRRRRRPSGRVQLQVFESLPTRTLAHRLMPQKKTHHGHRHDLMELYHSLFRACYKSGHCKVPVLVRIGDL